MTRNIDAERTESSNSPDQDRLECSGKMTSLEVKRGLSIDYAIIIIDCDGSKQAAFIFAHDTIAQAERAADRALASGVQPTVWFSGSIVRSDRDGVATCEMRIDRFEDRTEYDTAIA